MRDAREMVLNRWRKLIPPLGAVGWEIRGVVGGGLSRVCGGKLVSIGGLGRDLSGSVVIEEVWGFEAVGGWESGGK